MEIFFDELKQLCNKEEVNLLELQYTEAFKKLQNALDALQKEYISLEDENPIIHMKYRVKKEESILEKLSKKQKEYTISNIKDNVSDIIGARIVCTFKSDIIGSEKNQGMLERLKEKLKDDYQIEILNEKDYISHPKENGYASYHIVIAIPVSIKGISYKVKAEIQIRTIAMDMWASLDHKIRYKKGISLSVEKEKSIINTALLCQDLDEYLDKLHQKEIKLRQQQDTNSIDKTIQDTTSIDKTILETQEYKKMIARYHHALSNVKEIINYINKLYSIDEEFFKGVNPIEHIKYRLKTNKNILLKASKKTDNITIESIENSMNDIAGIRIVCSFKKDLKEILNNIKSYFPEQIIEEKDYVSHPKQSGYAGYHIIVQIPILQDDKLIPTKVEIQIRTIAMDMWASLQRKLCYKKEATEETREELLRLAAIRDNLDRMMEEILLESNELRKNQQSKKRERKKNTDQQ